jgi:hypothetical protein
VRLPLVRCSRRGYRASFGYSADEGIAGAGELSTMSSEERGASGVPGSR